MAFVLAFVPRVAHRRLQTPERVPFVCIVERAVARALVLANEAHVIVMTRRKLTCRSSLRDTSTRDAIATNDDKRWREQRRQCGLDRPPEVVRRRERSRR